MRIKRVNIGEIIRNKVEVSGMSKAKFAESVGIQRQNIEKTVFSKHSIDTDLLCNICEVLDCNFFEYYSSNEVVCNKINYKQELKAKLTIELGEERKDKVFRFVFGENDIEIK